LLGAGLISLTGDWMLGIGIAYYVYVLTGSTLASAGSMLASWLPSVLVGSFAGVFVDRWDRKRTMVVAHVLLAVGLMPLLLVHHPDDVWIVYAVTIFEGTVEQFGNPAERALVPLIVPVEDLPTANALNGQAREVGRLVGAAAGGIVVATGGITALAIADALTFLAAAVLVAGLRVDSRAHPVEPTSMRRPTGIRRLTHEWSQGLRIAATERSLRVVFLYTLIAMTGEGIMGTLFAPFVRDVLHGSGRAYGIIASVQAVGGLIGGVVAATLARRLSPVAMFGFGAVLFGAIDLTMFVYPLVYVALWPAAACMVVVGVPGAVSNVGYNTLLQTHTEDAHRGRVFGALSAPQGVGILTGALVGGVLGSSVGIVPVLAFQGISGIVAGLMVLVVLRHDIRQAPAAAVS
jgi:predicted MFS family arabinose efflux permease